MKVELKSFKHMASLSEETLCFSARLYVNGKAVADCSNRGHGGMTDVYPLKPEFRSLLEDVVAHYQNTVPKQTIEVGGKTEELDWSLDFIVDVLAGDAEATADLKRRLRNKTLFTDKDGRVFAINAPFDADGSKKGLTADRLAQIGQRDGFVVDKILNALPLPDALKIFREQSA